jgi:glutathione S-transferase
MADTFTIADILAVHCLDWAEKAKMPVTAPALLAYRERAHARPAFRKVAGMMAPVA